MINATSRPNASFGHPTHPHHLQSTIQLPMIGPLGALPPNRPPQSQQQQQQQPPQQQQGPQPSEIPIPPQSGQDFTLSNVLHFLQTEWRRYERDRNEWEIERAEMRVRRDSSPRCVRVLNVASPRPGANSSAGGRAAVLRQCQARPHAPYQNAGVCAARRAVRPLPTFIVRRPDVSLHSSKQLAQPASQAVPPTKLATLQAHLGEKKDDAYSHKEGSSGSSPRSEGASRSRHSGVYD